MLIKNLQQGVIADRNHGFISQIKKKTTYLVIMSEKETGLNMSNMLKKLSTQHGLKFYECHVFDTLRRQAFAFQLSSMSVTKSYILVQH